ncbi:MAG: rRNA maturation RNase YbeY [Candidatus Buchananbacteria bacterium]
MISFEINQMVKPKIARTHFVRIFNKINKTLNIKKAEVSLAIVSDSAIKKMNKIYRGIDRPTDVLSFGKASRQAGLDFTPKNYLGEIIISLEQAARQAKAAKQSLPTELERLISHGFLHLLGYDHEQSKRAAQAMAALEEKIVKQK